MTSTRPLTLPFLGNFLSLYYFAFCPLTRLIEEAFFHLQKRTFEHVNKFSVRVQLIAEKCECELGIVAKISRLEVGIDFGSKRKITWSLIQL